MWECCWAKPQIVIFAERKEGPPISDCHLWMKSTQEHSEWFWKPEMLRHRLRHSWRASFTSWPNWIKIYLSEKMEKDRFCGLVKIDAMTVSIKMYKQEYYFLRSMEMQRSALSLSKPSHTGMGTFIWKKLVGKYDLNITTTVCCTRPLVVLHKW